jgi:hypothetical protein
MTLTVLVTGPPLGVTLAGEKVQVAPWGNPEQLRPMAALNPLAGVNVTVRVDACPAVRFRVALLTVMAYVGVDAPATVTVTAVEVEGPLLASPP